MGGQARTALEVPDQQQLPSPGAHAGLDLPVDGRSDPREAGSGHRGQARRGGPPLTEVAVEEWAPGAPARGRAARRSSTPRARTGPQAPEPERTRARHRRRIGTTPQADPQRAGLTGPGSVGSGLAGGGYGRQRRGTAAATSFERNSGREKGGEGRRSLWERQGRGAVRPPPPSLRPRGLPPASSGGGELGRMGQAPGREGRRRPSRPWDDAGARARKRETDRPLEPLLY